MINQVEFYSDFPVKRTVINNMHPIRGECRNTLFNEYTAPPISVVTFSMGQRQFQSIILKKLTENF